MIVGERVDGEVFDIVALGNALVDVVSSTDDAFLLSRGLAKGTMTLVDAGLVDELAGLVDAGVVVSGGSAANTAAGVASFGGSAAFLGRVGDDRFGDAFASDISAAGVRFVRALASDGRPTGRCLVLVTPDAERTMCTHLGASTYLGPEDVDADIVGRAQVVYLEGYLWDEPCAREAFRRAAEIARAAGRAVAFTLSDVFCVDRHRAEFLEFVRDDVDILFANEAELCSLYDVTGAAAALASVRSDCQTVVVTRQEKGAVIVCDERVHPIDAHRLPPGVVDTTGAGDLFAAGFLHGLTRGHDPETAGRLGAIAAAEVISHPGARPQTPLSELADSLLAHPLGGR